MKKRRLDCGDVCIAAVCDGVGGLADGAFASSAAVRMLSEWFDGLHDCRRMGLQMRDAVLEINREIADAAQSRELHTATTLSALLLSEERYYIVHTGDSRIYAWSSGALLQMTQDQAFNGRLTACLGRSRRTELIYDEGQQAGRNFLLCSDGLYKRMTPDYLLSELEQMNRKNLRRVLGGMAGYVMEHGEKDNISLAAILCGD